MDTKASSPAGEAPAGQRLYEFAAKLYPICRSITGAGVRQTLALIRARVPLVIHEVPSATRVLDWKSRTSGMSKTPASPIRTAGA